MCTVVFLEFGVFNICFQRSGIARFNLYISLIRFCLVFSFSYIDAELMFPVGEIMSLTKISPTSIQFLYNKHVPLCLMNWFPHRT